MQNIRKSIFGKFFQEQHKKEEKDFTRRRKFGFSDIVLFQLRNAGKSLGVELKQFLRTSRIKATEYSKQAYSKARMKIKHSGFIELNDILLDEYYSDDDYKTYKGYRLLGIDGTEIELQHGFEIKKIFGQVYNKRESINASKATVVYDLQNELVLDSEMNRYNSCDRQSTISQLGRMKTKGQQRRDILVADRGFPSLELFCKLLEMGYDFVIRYNGQNFLKEAMALATSQKSELEIEISLWEGNQRKKNPALKRMLESGHPEVIKLRIVKIKLNENTTEYLITSLLSGKGFTINDFKEIYNLRWNEEVYFDFQKNVMEVENFSGKTVESIKQDYYSRILVSNIHSLIVQEAQEELNGEVKENPKLKYSQYKINRSISFGMMKESIYDLLTVRNWKKEWAKLRAESKKHKIPVIKNRSFERVKKGNLKFPMNKKRVL